MRLRAALGPYLYTEARRAYDTGLIVTHPLYYDWPEDDAVYAAGHELGEYSFGPVVLASPVWATNETVRLVLQCIH
jgi:alpha-glucosidase (family GH31 glycosyl hydrolase)